MSPALEFLLSLVSFSIALLILVDYMMYFINSVGITTVSPFNDTIIREGNTATITCEAFGYPPPTIVWSRLDGSLSDRVFVNDSVSIPTGYGNVTRVSVNLIILTTSREDTGKYMCSASNEIGSDDSSIGIIIECKFIILINYLAAMTYNQVHYFRVDHLADFTQMDTQKSL